MGRRGGAGSLSEVVQFLRGDIALEPMRSVNGWSDVGSAEQELDFGEVKGQQHVKRAKSLRPVGIISSPLDLLRRTRLNPLNFRCYAYWHRGTNPRNDEVLELLKPWIDKFSWRAGPAIAGPVDQQKQATRTLFSTGPKTRKGLFRHLLGVLERPSFSS
jgi:hypothetical protein